MHIHFTVDASADCSTGKNLKINVAEVILEAHKYRFESYIRPIRLSGSTMKYQARASVESGKQLMGEILTDVELDQRTPEEMKLSTITEG